MSFLSVLDAPKAVKGPRKLFPPKRVCALRYLRESSKLAILSRVTAHLTSTSYHQQSCAHTSFARSLSDSRIEYVNVATTVSDVLMIQLFHCTSGVILSREENKGVASGPTPRHVDDHILLRHSVVTEELSDVLCSSRIR